MNTRENKSAAVIGKITNVKSGKKGSSVHIEIDKELALQLMQFKRCPDGEPKIISMTLGWVENTSDFVEAKPEETKTAATDDKKSGAKDSDSKPKK
jgi:hypothetical protein